MNLDSLSFTLSQISYLVANLSKKNFEDSYQEISSVSIERLYDLTATFVCSCVYVYARANELARIFICMYV